MAKITKLGFVLDPDAQRPRYIVKGCLAKFEEGERQFWQAFPVGPSTFIRRLFVLSEYAVRVLHGLQPAIAEGPAAYPQTRVLIDYEDPDHAFLITYLMDMSSRQKEQNKLRYKVLGTHLGAGALQLFKRHGEKNKNAVLGIPLDWEADQFFFWTPEDYAKFVNPPELPKKALGEEVTVQENGLSTTSFDVLRLSALAERVRLETVPKQSWLDLYRSALLSQISEAKPSVYVSVQATTEPERKVTSDFSSSQVKAPLLQEQKPRDAVQAIVAELEQSDFVALTGPAGSGKTTVLNGVMEAYLRPPGGTRAKGRPIPVYLRFTDLGDLLVSSGREAARASLADVISAAVKEALGRRCSKKELARCRVVREALKSSSSFSGAPITRVKMLGLIQEEVREWVEEHQDRRSVAILLLDGLSEVAFQELATARVFLGEATSSPWKILGTARYRFTLIREFPFSQFRLVPLSDKDGGPIYRYLDTRFPGRGKGILSKLRRENKRLLDLIGRPFFLSLYAAALDPNTPRVSPDTEAGLIRRFIGRSLSRKLEGEGTGRLKISPSSFHDSLKTLASKLLSQESPYLAYPRDFRGAGDGTNWSDALYLAQRVGLLEKSGLFPEETHDPGVIRFEHDLFRDYYGALWLRDEVFNEAPAVTSVDRIMEYSRWGNAILMYFDIVRDADCQHRLIREVLQRDPYFATRAIRRRSDWKAETISTAIWHLRQWEFDQYPRGERLEFSTDGVAAARVLLKKLGPEEIDSAYEAAEPSSLVRVAAPAAIAEVLGKGAVEPLISWADRHGDNCGDLLSIASSLRSLANKGALPHLLKVVGHILSLSESTLVRWCALTYVMDIPVESFDHLVSLASGVASPLVRDALYVNVRRLPPKVAADLRQHEDPLVSAMATLGSGEAEGGEYAGFIEHLEDVGPSCLQNLAYCRLLSELPPSCSGQVIPILKRWFERATEEGWIYDQAGESALQLCQIGTDRAMLPIARALYSLPLEKATLILGWVSALVYGPIGHGILSGLKSIGGDAAYDRRLLLLRNFFNDTFTKAEQDELNRIAQQIFKPKPSWFVPRPDAEFDFAVTCLRDLTECYLETHPRIRKLLPLKRLAPIGSLFLRFMVEEEFSKLLRKGTPRDYREAIRILAEGLVGYTAPGFRGNSRLVATLLLPVGACNIDEGLFIRELWKMVRQFLRKGSSKKAQALVKYARGLTDGWGRRWLLTRGKWPTGD